MYKLMAIDLDGTLLDSYGNVSEENKQAIKNALENGIEVVIASGRPIMSVKSIASRVGASKYIICGNGAVTYDMDKEEIIYDRFIDKEKVLQIVKICEENSIYYSIYTEDTILTKSLNYNVLFFNQENAKKEPTKRVKINIVQDIYEYIKSSDNQKYLKITICDDNKVIFTGILKKLREINKIEVLDVAHMSRKVIKSGTEDVLVEYYYTEITSENVDKWFAIKDLIEKIGINENEVIAIGDNVNDLMMIEKSGKGIVMQDSAEYIKEKADYVTCSNDESGVAKAINDIINNYE